MANIFENPEQQKKLCNILRSICLYGTFITMAYLLAAMWIPDFAGKETAWKVFLTYLVVLIGSIIIQRIFVESPKSKEDKEL